MAVDAAALRSALGLSVGVVKNVEPLARGAGYKSSLGAAVTVGPPPAGTGHRTAIVRAVLLYGAAAGEQTSPVSHYHVIDGGAGYVTAPTIAVAVPPADSNPRTLATAVATVDPVADVAALLAQATALVDAYLRGGTAPDEIRDEAIIRTAGHVTKRRGFGVAEGNMMIGHGAVTARMAPGSANPIRQSGAAQLLSPWVRRRA